MHPLGAGGGITETSSDTVRKPVDGKLPGPCGTSLGAGCCSKVRAGVPGTPAKKGGNLMPVQISHR